MARKTSGILVSFGAAVLASLVAASASAQASVPLDLPAQALGDTLRALGKHTDTNILIDPQLVRNIRAPAIKGTLTADQALTQLLGGTHLRYRFIDERTVVLDSTAEPAAATDKTSLHREEREDVLRLAQVDQASPPSAESSAAREQQLPRDSSAQLEEIIVTAQKREERLIDVPQSVSVLSATQLANLGATQFRDFADTVPGLNFSTAGAGSTQISLRGVTVGFDVVPTVGIYVDEVPYGTSGAFADGARSTLDVGLFDIDRIEVLRGPQGTLYGASTMGGLIKYVSRLPDSTRLSFDGQFGVSSTRHGGVSYNTAAALNAPIVADTIALRASAFYSHDGGYFDNLALGKDDVNESGVYGGRADLLLTPTDALSVRLTAFLQNISRDAMAAADYTLAGEPEDGDLDQRRLLDEPLDQRFRLVSGVVTYDFESATLTSVSSYQTSRTHFLFDFSRRFVPFFTSYGAIGLEQEVSTDKFVQEVRLASQRADILEWVIGAFYTHESSDNLQQFVLRDVAGQPTANILYDFSAPTLFEEAAAFGNLTWHLTGKLDVSGGMRYAHNRQEFTQFGSGLLIGSTPTRRSSEDVSTFLANARYHLSDQSTVYVRYATGYRPGGPNFVANDPTTGLPIAPETFDADRLKSYEAGIKAETLDRRFGLDLAAYYIDWSDIQILATRGGFSVYTNAPGGAEVRGAELTLTSRPIDDLTLTGAFAYQDAQMLEADTDLGAAAGERLPNVPRFTAAINADYQLPIGRGDPTIGATLRHVGDRNASFDGSTGTPQYRLPEYTTIDVRARLTLGSVAALLYVRNLFDERGQLSAFNFVSGGQAVVAVMQPRTIGVTLTTRF